MSTNVTNSPASIMQVIQQTPPTQIAELDFVKDKFIQNYNHCHRSQNGDLMYHKTLIHFKQLLQGSDALRNCDPFSLYACLVTIAARGYSLDPQDDEVYLIPRKGKAAIQRQAGAHVRRLITSGQIIFAEQPVLVFEGDTFLVQRGRVIDHIEAFKSNNIIAGYIRYVIDDKGTDRFFVYRPSDWLSWKKKSDMKEGANWTGNNGQPEPGFLRTKIVLHSAKEKCWATGHTQATVELYEDIEFDVIDDEAATNAGTSAPAAPQQPPPPDDSFVAPPNNQGGVSFNDDDF
jgi:recombinational DNA repair protein RecT